MRARAPSPLTTRPRLRRRQAWSAANASARSRSRALHRRADGPPPRRLGARPSRSHRGSTSVAGPPTRRTSGRSRSHPRAPPPRAAPPPSGSARGRRQPDLEDADAVQLLLESAAVARAAEAVSSWSGSALSTCTDAPRAPAEQQRERAGDHPPRAAGREAGARDTSRSSSERRA